MKELKPGDLVKCYGNPQNGSCFYHLETARVIAVDNYWITVEFINTQTGRSYIYHRKQVRLLKTKKVKPITRADIKEAWGKSVKAIFLDKVSDDFIKELERIIGRKIK